MTKKQVYETALDDFVFGFFGDDEEFHEVEPETDFERAVVDSLDDIRCRVRDELIMLANRLDEKGSTE